MRILTIVLCSLTLCVACGQKGPLYLPEEPAPRTTDFPCAPADAPCRQNQNQPADEAPGTQPQTAPTEATTESATP